MFEIPDNFPHCEAHKFAHYKPELQAQIMEYLSQLPPIEIQAYFIAYDHLESSFCIPRSNGFIAWQKNKNPK